MIVFDFLSGQLKFVNNPSKSENPSALVDFGNRHIGDMSLDMGERLVEESIIDLDFRV